MLKDMATSSEMGVSRWDLNGLADPYVRVRLVPESSSKAKLKRERWCDPIFVQHGIKRFHCTFACVQFCVN